LSFGFYVLNGAKAAACKLDDESMSAQPPPAKYVCKSGRCVANPRGLSLADCQQICIAPAPAPGPPPSPAPTPCQAGATGGNSGIEHPTPVCRVGSCNASNGVFTAACSAAECGEQLQAAFDSCCPTINIPSRADGSPWVTASTLWLRSNSNITFSRNVTILAKRGEFKTKGAPLFIISHSNGVDQNKKVKNATNITINGYGAEWRMWKLDYGNSSLYCPSEARPGLWMTWCTGCRIFGLTVTMTGGDQGSSFLSDV